MFYSVVTKALKKPGWDEKTEKEKGSPPLWCGTCGVQTWTKLRNKQERYLKGAEEGLGAAKPGGSETQQGRRYFK